LEVRHTTTRRHAGADALVRLGTVAVCHRGDLQMTNKFLLALTVAGKRFLHGFYLSGVFVFLMFLAFSSDTGELFWIVLILGAIVGLPWTTIFFPALGLTDQRMDFFFSSLVPGHTEWDAVLGLAIATVFLGLHINGMLFFRSRPRNKETN